MDKFPKDILGRKLDTLVENRTVFNTDNAQLNLYETFQFAENIQLAFDYPVLVSMLSGKKVMHMDNMGSFGFYPGETLVLQRGEEMGIDFPIATIAQPTQCIALGINPDIINSTVSTYNSLLSDTTGHQISGYTPSSKLKNNSEIQRLIQGLITTFSSNESQRDILLDLMLKELVVRLAQSDARATILNSYHSNYDNHNIGHVVEYIRSNITTKHTNRSLAKKAHMSESTFLRTFKHVFGISPNQYIIQERLKLSKKLLLYKNKTTAETAFLVGFNNVSYFIRQFKNAFGCTPREFVLSRKDFK